MSNAIATKSSAAAAPKAASAAAKAPARKRTAAAKPVETAPLEQVQISAATAALPEAEAKAIASAVKNQPTAVHENMVAWLASAGVVADLETVKLAFALRHVFQKSEMNQNDLVNRKSAAESKLQERAVAAAERAKKAMERAEKLAAAAKAAK